MSGFIAGQLYGNLGSFIQITGNPTPGFGVENDVFVDASDVRYADTLTLFGKETIWGIDANNTPTVEDPWNTTPSFGWPQISSTIAPAFGPPLTHIESGLGQIVGGAGAYVFWNDMLYGAFTAYKGLPVPVLQAFNTGNSTTDALSNVAPYWRVAIEPHWAALFGRRNIRHVLTGHPGRIYGFGTDDFLDVGFDSQIQYAGDQYSLTLKLTDIMEWQRLNSSFAQAGSSNLSNKLNSFKANASFVWDHTYSVGVGYFNIAGSGDCNLYGSGNNVFCTPTSIGSFNNSFISSPNGSGLIHDLAYLPFSNGAPFPYSTWNVRIGLQFTEYLHVYGGTTNFDGSNWAARITRRATIPCSPTRGSRSESFAAPPREGWRCKRGVEQIAGACAAAGVKLAPEMGREHCQPGPFSEALLTKSGLRRGDERALSFSALAALIASKLRRLRAQNSNSGQSERRRGSFKRQPGQGEMEGCLTPTQYAEPDGHLFRPLQPADRRSFPWAGLLIRADAGGECLDRGWNAWQSR